MIKKIKLILASIMLVASLGMPFALAVPANAASTSSECAGANGNLASLSGDSSCAGKQGSDAGNDINKTISLVLNLFSAIVALIAVIMIIVGGVKYVTSGGSSEKTTSAKDTILFAIVGLIVVALAQIIVRFVLHKTAAL